MSLGKPQADTLDGTDLRYSLYEDCRETVSKEIKLMPRFYFLDTVYTLLGDDVYLKSKIEP